LQSRVPELQFISACPTWRAAPQSFRRPESIETVEAEIFQEIADLTSASNRHYRRPSSLIRGMRPCA
jgi:hypothetical protein